MTWCQAYSDAITAGSCCYTTRVSYPFRAEHQLHGRHSNSFTPCLPVTDLLLFFPGAGLTQDGGCLLLEMIWGTDTDIAQCRRHLLQYLGEGLLSPRKGRTKRGNVPFLSLLPLNIALFTYVDSRTSRKM